MRAFRLNHVATKFLLDTKYECDVKLFCEPSNDEYDTSWKKRTRYVVREVKRIVDAARKLAYKKALQAYGRKKLTDAQKREAFGYVPDEVDLDGTSDEEDAKRVLDTIGRGTSSILSAVRQMICTIQVRCKSAK